MIAHRGDASLTCFIDYLKKIINTFCLLLQPYNIRQTASRCYQFENFRLMTTYIIIIKLEVATWRIAEHLKNTQNGNQMTSFLAVTKKLKV